MIVGDDRVHGRRDAGRRALPVLDADDRARRAHRRDGRGRGRRRARRRGHRARRPLAGPHATGPRRSRPATQIRVIEVDGLVLEVEPEAGGARDYRDRRPKKTPDDAEHAGDDDGLSRHGSWSTVPPCDGRGARSAGGAAGRGGARRLRQRRAAGGSDSSRGSTTARTVTVVAQNLLARHRVPGRQRPLQAPAAGRAVRPPARAADCPQVVSVEEADPVMSGLLRDQAHDICDGSRLAAVDDRVRSTARSSSPRCRCSARSGCASPARCAPRSGCASARRSARSTSSRRTSRAAATTDRAIDDLPAAVRARRHAQHLPGPPGRGAPRRPHAFPSRSACSSATSTPSPVTRRSPRSSATASSTRSSPPGTPSATRDRRRLHQRAPGRRPLGPHEPGSRQQERIDYVFLATKRTARVTPADRAVRRRAGEPADVVDRRLASSRRSDHTGVPRRSRA